MPTLRVSHNREHHWEITKRADVPEDGVFTAAAKDDEVNLRSTVDLPGGYTTVSIPETELTRERWQRTLALVPERKVQPTEDNPGGFLTDPAEIEADEHRRRALALQQAPPVTRRALVAEYLQKAILPYHVPPGAVTHFECAEEPALADYLNHVFECEDGEVSPLPEQAEAVDVADGPDHWRVPSHAEWPHQPEPADAGDQAAPAPPVTSPAAAAFARPRDVDVVEPAPAVEESQS